MPRVKITQMPDESPLLSLCDAADKILLTLIVKDGNSGIYLYDSERRPRAILSVGQQPALVILDEDQQPLATFPTDADADDWE